MQNRVCETFLYRYVESGLSFYLLPRGNVTFCQSFGRWLPIKYMLFLLSGCVTNTVVESHIAKQGPGQSQYLGLKLQRSNITKSTAYG